MLMYGFVGYLFLGLGFIAAFTEASETVIWGCLLAVIWGCLLAGMLNMSTAVTIQEIRKSRK